MTAAAEPFVSDAHATAQAMRALAALCKRGHPLTRENTITYNGSRKTFRQCRTCAYAAKRRYDLRHPRPPRPRKPRVRKDTIDRIFAHCIEDGECIVWDGKSRSANGYGVAMCEDGRTTLAHRAVWEAIYCPVPPGYDVCHSCDNRLCVLPAHLWMGTREDNMRDAAEKGRTARARIGRTPTNRALSDDDVAFVRALSDTGLVTQRWLARRFGVSAFTIESILLRRYEYFPRGASA